MLKIQKLLASCAVLILAACDPSDKNRETPLDRPAYPMGLAQFDSKLLVVSTNFDLRNKSGALLEIDLDKVDSKIDQFQVLKIASNDRAIDGSDVISKALKIPSFGTSPAIIATQNQLVLPTRVDNQVSLFSVANNNLVEQSSLDSGIRDPYFVETTSIGGSEIMFVGSLTSSQLGIHQINGNQIVPMQNSIDLATFVRSNEVNERFDSFRIRGLKVLTPEANRPSILFVALESYSDNESVFLSAKAVSLIWFELNPNVIAGQVKKEDITIYRFTKENLGKEIHGFDFSDDGKDLYVVMQQPDSIIRLNWRAVQANKREDIIMGVNSTCRYPVDVKVSKNSAYVACFFEPAVAMYDRTSLAEQYISRDFGRGPLQILIDKRNNNRMYVSNYLDGSIGVLDTGNLAFLGRIFKQSPENEDGGL